MLYTGALAELEAERLAYGSNIHTPGAALWWAVTTITAVGYGDYCPVTGQRRLITAALMIAGVALLGVVTASLASWLVQRVRVPTNGGSTADEEQTDEVHRLRAEVAELRARLQLDE